MEQDVGRLTQGLPSELARLEGDEIVIRVPVTALPYASSIAWERAYGEHSLIVSDLPRFTAEFIRALNAEEENGDTLLHRALDRAAVDVCEWGGDGIADAVAHPSSPSQEDQTNG